MQNRESITEVEIRLNHKRLINLFQLKFAEYGAKIEQTHGHILTWYEGGEPHEMLVIGHKTIQMYGFNYSYAFYNNFIVLLRSVKGVLHKETINLRDCVCH